MEIAQADMHGIDHYWLRDTYSKAMESCRMASSGTSTLASNVSKLHSVADHRPAMTCAHMNNRDILTWIGDCANPN